MPHKEIDLSKLFLVLKAKQKRIWQTTVATTLIAIIYCIFAPPIFTAKIVINPPKLTDAGNGAAQVLGDMSGLSFGGGFMLQKTDVDMAIAILKTAQLKNMVIKKFDLIKYYGGKDIELTRFVLDGTVKFLPDAKSGFIEIDVDDKDPKLAADIANYYTVALGQVISNVAYGKSIQKKQFYLVQLEVSKNNLHQAQANLKEFAKKNGIASGQQVEIVAGLITQLQAQLVVARSQLQAMSLYATVNNPDYKTLQATVDSLRKQLDSISGQENSSNNLTDQLSVPSNLAPELANEYTNLERNVLMNEEILKVLFRQYETSRIEGFSELAPTAIQVIDPALVPLHKSKPKRLLVVIIGFILGVVLSSIYIIIRNRKQILVTARQE